MPGKLGGVPGKFAGMSAGHGNPQKTLVKTILIIQ
jgi:hypothetical protein